MAFQNEFSAMRALRDEYDQVSVRAIQAKTKVENLERIVQEKEEKVVQLDGKSQHTKEKLASLIHQNQAVDSTIQHYREVKR